jgi:hypothetical protein
MEATLQILGVIGFFTGTVAFVIRVWEALFQRSRFEADVNWIMNTRPIVFSFVIMNTGHRKDGIREIRLATEDDPDSGGWVPRPGVWEHLPLILDVNEISRRFLLQPDPNSPHRADRALLDGRVTKLIVDHTRPHRRTVLRVPGRPS